MVSDGPLCVLESAVAGRYVSGFLSLPKLHGGEHICQGCPSLMLHCVASGRTLSKACRSHVLEDWFLNNVFKLLIKYMCLY